MSAGTAPIFIGNISSTPALRAPSVPPTLLPRHPTPRRTKLWEFNSSLHCSIIGTCLSTAELRKILGRVGAAASDATDHELHGVAVTLAGRNDAPARQLHKALDQRHRLAVSQFGKADTPEALSAMWHEARRRGDIPGAYWATLTHSCATPAIIREAFGDVHMLSHLVGAANRTDIRRLCTLEAEKAALEEKLERQQQALHDAVTRRDAQIAALRQALADRLAVGVPARPAEAAVLQELAADRERRLAAETRRRAAVEERLAAALAEGAADRSTREKAEREIDALRRELAAIEAAWATRADGTPADATPADAAPAPRLDGTTLLYVGGRPNQLTHIRLLIEHLGGTLLHHDGGLEDHRTLLPGLASRCDVAVFPVDCISHDAANAVKSACRNTGKRCIPLRSASVTSVLAALRTTLPERVA